MINLQSYILQFDVLLFNIINHARSPFLDSLMIKVSDFDFFAPFIACFILFRLYRGGTRERIFWIIGIIAIILSDALCARILKPLIGRPRPYLSLDNILVFKGSKWLITDPNVRSQFSMNFSWPSCHASNIWTATFYIGKYRLSYGLLIAPIAMLVTYSRIYLGVHYPLDCLGGLFVGIIIGLSMSFVFKILANKFSY